MSILAFERSPIRLALTLSCALALAACAGEQKSAPDSARSAAQPAAPAAGGPLTPSPGGKVVVVELITDEKGNYFNPAKFEVHSGDVIRFTLKAGVHNVDFLSDSNPRVAGLPGPSDMLQLPGQSFDVAVSFPKGHYYFQCDPHALLGMKGRLEVE